MIGNFSNTNCFIPTLTTLNTLNLKTPTKKENAMPRVIYTDIQPSPTTPVLAQIDQLIGEAEQEGQEVDHVLVTRDEFTQLLNELEFPMIALAPIMDGIELNGLLIAVEDAEESVH